VPPDRSKSTDDDHRVVPFRPRGGSKYEGGGEYDDNYRHRMMVNIAALGFTAVLAIAGVWLVMQLADLRKNQDCVLSGRRNCAPIDVKATER
jgi:hypothetical protein